jgi:hypothetical protein
MQGQPAQRKPFATESSTTDLASASPLVKPLERSNSRRYFGTTSISNNFGQSLPVTNRRFERGS